MELEIWKDIPGYEGEYQASNKGRVKRVSRVNSSMKEKILAPDLSGDYPKVHLWKKGESKKVKVHQLILLTFVGLCPKGLVINHKNGEKTNNQLENLEYVTVLENNRHAWRIGLISRRHWRGQHGHKICDALRQRNTLNKIKVDRLDLNNNYIDTFESVCAAGAFLNKDRSSIKDCIHGKQKTAFGFKWRKSIK